MEVIQQLVLLKEVVVSLCL